MKKLLLLIIFFLPYCGNRNSFRLLLFYNKKDNVFVYKFYNESTNVVFLLKDEGYNDMVYQDSIIFEPSYTFRDPKHPRPILPNVYKAPSMTKVDPKSNYTDTILEENSRYNKDREYSYFFRVYNKDLKDYGDSLGYSPYVMDFIEFQMRHSILIKAEKWNGR